MKFKMKNLSHTLKSLIVAFSFVGGLSYVFAWTGPSTIPPNGNVSAPVNVGDVGQTKTGYFGASELLAGTNTAEVFCIGTNCINSWSNVGGGVPSGAVMAFNLNSCPAGWAEFASANGRQIIGLGTSGVAEGGSHYLGESAGSEVHNLTVEELAPHGHNYTDTTIEGGTSNPPYSIPTGLALTHKFPNLRETSNAKIGSVEARAKSFSVMDPYIALKYCTKL